MKFNSKLEKFNMKKSDIHNKKLKSKIKNKLLN